MAFEGKQAVAPTDDERLTATIPPPVRRFGRGRPQLVAVEQLGTAAIPEGRTSARVLRRDTLYRRGLAISDMLAAAVAAGVSVTVLGDDGLKPAALVLLPLIVLAGKTLGLYDRDQNLIRKTTLGELPALFQVATIFTLFAWFSESKTVDGALSKPQVGAMLLILLGALASGRELVRQALKRASGPERCLVLGDQESAFRLQQKFDSSYSMRAELVGRVPLEPERGTALRTGPAVLGSTHLLGLVLEVHDVDRVIVAPHTARSEQILEAIRLVRSLGIKVSLLPRMLDVVGSSVEFDDVDGITLLGLRGFGLSKSSKLLKRALDLCGATLAVAALAPLLAWIAVAVKLNSSGPVLFRQKRIGRDGKPFEMLKFRTMYDGADALKAQLRSRNEAAEGLFKIANDPRVTKVGRFLRRASLDELPQLFNVLRGDMSLVGPRPLVVDEDRNIKGWERQRLNVSPGMTGYWQILGSSRVPRAEMVKIDYLYGANWSLWLDVKILLRTIPHVVARRGL